MNSQWICFSVAERTLQICLTTLFFYYYYFWGLVWVMGFFANYCTLKNKTNRTPTSSNIWKRALCRKTCFRGTPYFAQTNRTWWWTFLTTYKSWVVFENKRFLMEIGPSEFLLADTIYAVEGACIPQ